MGQGDKIVMPQTKLETELRLVARERIARGQLPCGATSRMWSGHGSDLPCALCDKPIQPDEVEYEVELRESGALHTIRFHILCQSMWQAECVRADHLKKRP